MASDQTTDSDDTERCGSCKFWVPTSEPNGICRRRPPAVLLVGMLPPAIQGMAAQPVTQSFWPQMLEYGWCGEWNGDPRPAIPAPKAINTLITTATEGNA